MLLLGDEWEMGQHLAGDGKPFAKPWPEGDFRNQVFLKLGQPQRTQNMTDKP